MGVTGVKCIPIYILFRLIYLTGRKLHRFNFFTATDPHSRSHERLMENRRSPGLVRYAPFTDFRAQLTHRFAEEAKFQMAGARP